MLLSFTCRFPSSYFLLLLSLAAFQNRSLTFPYTLQGLLKKLPWTFSTLSYLFIHLIICFYIASPGDLVPCKSSSSIHSQFFSLQVPSLLSSFCPSVAIEVQTTLHPKCRLWQILIRRQAFLHLRTSPRLCIDWLADYLHPCWMWSRWLSSNCINMVPSIGGLQGTWDQESCDIHSHHKASFLEHWQQMITDYHKSPV